MVKTYGNGDEQLNTLTMLDKNKQNYNFDYHTGRLIVSCDFEVDGVTLTRKVIDFTDRQVEYIMLYGEVLGKTEFLKGR